MNRIKFITFLYVSLFSVSLFSENNYIINMKGGNEEFCNQNFEFDSLFSISSFLENSRAVNMKDGHEAFRNQSFKFESPSQQNSVCEETIVRNFTVEGFYNPYCCKFTLAEYFIHNAEKDLRKDIDNINGEGKYQDTKACTIRKFLLDVLQCNENKRSCYVDPVRVFLLFPLTVRYEEAVKQLKDELFNRQDTDSYDDTNIKILYNTIYMYFYCKTLVSFFFRGDIDYDLCIKKCKINGKNVDRDLQDDAKVLQVTLHTDKDMMLIGNEFVNFVRFKLKSNKDFDYTHCSEGSVENVCECFLRGVKFCKGNVLAGMSKMYFYIPIPDDKYDEAKSIVDGINDMRKPWIFRAFNSIFGYLGY